MVWQVRYENTQEGQGIKSIKYFMVQRHFRQEGIFGTNTRKARNKRKPVQAISFQDIMTNSFLNRILSETYSESRQTSKMECFGK